jgi:hypothetical protein
MEIFKRKSNEKQSLRKIFSLCDDGISSHLLTKSRTVPQGLELVLQGSASKTCDMLLFKKN